MKKNTLCLTALAPALLALGGCSVLGVDDVFNQESVQYESSSTRANLEVPPDMTPIGNDGRFDVPTRPSVVTASGEAARRAQQEASDANGATPASQIVASTVVAKVMRDGQQRWLRVNAPAEDLWVVVQDFWSSVGLTVREQNARTGFMETNWAENKARLPQDFIRGTIGKVLDFVYSTSERDQYRVRLERTEDGQTDVFLTHRSMVEVVKGKEGDTTIWQPGPTDPTLEAEMLQRLAVYIDAQFNPDAKPVDKEQIAKELQNLPTRALSEIERAADGTVSAVVINEAFDRAWRSVGLVIDRMAFDYTVSHGAIPAPLNYEGFPKSVCTSINEVVCHGIPSEDEILQEGDIINVDVSTILDGYYSDASRMFIIGKTTPEKEKLVRVTKECLEIGMRAAKPFGFVGDIGNAIQRHAEKNGFSVVRDLCGHGVGLAFHEEPEVLHFGRKGTGMLLVPGMVFTIEPMINMGDWHVFIDEDDGWTVVTDDEKPSAQWEHTFLMTENGLEILTY